ncbi:unnamed protein product [Heligmosomoides polygyrus]|uniref:RNA-directed DNA polymerase n=1 Tax=Heligmosomoides polygyrus TaxID=6339 RepID=A0A3P8CMZ7_HELPZ|nr:unnamed protein product [Heligmosomoides polygyrus]
MSYNFSTHSGCLMFEDRIVIPYSIKAAVLTDLHDGHPGMSRTKMLARDYCYWSNINKNTEDKLTLMKPAETPRNQGQFNNHQEHARRTSSQMILCGSATIELDTRDRLGEDPEQVLVTITDDDGDAKPVSLV